MLVIQVFSAIAPSAWAASSKVHRSSKLQRSKSFHVVDENAPTLTEISIFLYGTPDEWPKIAKFNGLRRPYRLHLGDKLKLPRKRSLKKSEGLIAVRNYWRKHFGLGDAFPSIPPTALPQGPEARTVAPTVEIHKTSEGKTAFVIPPGAAPPPHPPEAQAPTRDTEEIGLDQAKLLLDDGKTKDALRGFRKWRQKNPNYLPAWFYEFQCLKKLEQKSELSKALEDFGQANPSLQGIPVIENYRKWSAQ
jgi:hypothetical protein